MAYCCRCGCRSTIPAPTQADEQEVGGAIKGTPTRVFDAESAARISDVAVDVTAHNAVSIEVYPLGAGASATVSVEGASSKGGNYTPVIDPNGEQTSVTANKIFDVLVGAAWVKVRLASLSGKFTVIATPYISPGPTTITATVS